MITKNAQSERFWRNILRVLLNCPVEVRTVPVTVRNAELQAFHYVN